MKFTFKADLPQKPTAYPESYDLAMKLREVYEGRPFTTHDIKEALGVDGAQAMTLLHYMTINRIIDWVYDA